MLAERAPLHLQPTFESDGSKSQFQWICMAGIGRSVHLGALTTGAH